MSSARRSCGCRRCPCRYRRAELAWCRRSDRKRLLRLDAARRWQERPAELYRPRTRARWGERARGLCILGEGGRGTIRGFRVALGEKAGARYLTPRARRPEHRGHGDSLPALALGARTKREKASSFW